MNMDFVQKKGESYLKNVSYILSIVSMLFSFFVDNRISHKKELFSHD